MMNNSEYTLEEQLEDLKFQYEELAEVLNEVWCYHPNNVNFINPIEIYGEITKKLNTLEGKIGTLEFKINSKN